MVSAQKHCQNRVSHKQSDLTKHLDTCELRVLSLHDFANIPIWLVSGGMEGRGQLS